MKIGTTFIATAAIAMLQSQSSLAQERGEVFMATGLKTTEVTASSATVWTRLTKHPERIRKGVAFDRDDETLPTGRKLEDMMDSAVGAVGEVRLAYAAKGSGKWEWLDWRAVNVEADFSSRFKLRNLQSGTAYELKAEGRSGRSGKSTFTLVGGFRTPPANTETSEISFTVVTGQDYVRRDDDVNGHKVFREMLELDPDFFVHTGDVVYYDKPFPWAKNVELALYKWQATYSLPFQREFHKNVASYFMRDDHDITKNDSWPGQDYGELTWERGLRIFEEQTGLPTLPYRTIRWGKDLQIWLPAGRKYRSANTMPDGPEKTIWGSEQKQWLFESVKKSDAVFRILISPTPIVGPDRGGKKDNHANKGFKHEGDEIRRFVGSQKNMYLVCGDRHWQYVSVDTKTGVTEYSCGPTSDRHAGGWKNSNRSPMHKYLNVKGGFLRVVIKRVDGNPQAVFQHYGVNGNLYNEDTKHAQ